MATHTLTVPSPWQWNRMEANAPWPMFTFGNGSSQGSSILRNGNGYFTTVEPTDVEMSTATEIYLAGRIYTLTDQQNTDLVAAGYGALVVTT